MPNVTTGLSKLANTKSLNEKYRGNVALLCHSASVHSDYTHAIDLFIATFGKRFTKIFGPQHGLISNVQDNMIESDHMTHPHYNLPVYSLYSETRIPTSDMLNDIDHLFVDLQDVGTRIYTYIYTMTYVLEACAGLDIEVIILDRPNPIDAKTVEGNILDLNYHSFVGRHALPTRHGMTMAEIAKWHQSHVATTPTNLSIIEMDGYKRDMYFEETRLPFVMPSPNVPVVESCFPFVGTVLFEGTNISEGRGTTRPLEIVGHPDLNPYKLVEVCQKIFKQYNLDSGLTLRPMYFMPTFQKHAGVNCGGVFIHVTARKTYRPWATTQILYKEARKLIGDGFSYKTDPYEYEYDKNPLDLINGTNKLRQWAENDGSVEDLLKMEDYEDFQASRKSSLIY